MKGFVKVLLLVIAAIIALKFLPLIFALGLTLAGALLGLIAAAASAVIALVGGVLLLALLLSPIWIPILALVGVILLIKRSNRNLGV
jgi:hypothetical protein